VTSDKQVSIDDDDEIDFAAVARVLWGHKVVIALACVLCGLVAAGLAFSATPIYRAEVVVTEVHDRGMSGTSPLANQLGGLASLAGVNLTANSGKSQEAAAVLESRHLIEEFIKRSDLVPVLSQNAKRPLTVWRAVKQFKGDVLAIRRDLRRGVTTVAVEWTDPVTSARWANGFVALANELIRSRALAESNRNIVYLNDQIAHTNVIELRKVMYDIIESETKSLMLANGRVEYAFEVVDPAVPPEVSVRPHRALMILVGVALGLLIGAMTALIVDRTLRHKRADLASERDRFNEETA
jgi:uncharacterized protein involved in exopolysaccharide biosynthesis